MGSWGLFSRQTRLAGSRGTAPKAGAKRLSFHHKYAFSGSGAIKGAKCLYSLVQCVAMRDQFLQRNLRVDHEPSNLYEFRLAKGPRAIDGGHLENDIPIEVNGGGTAHTHVA